jgi:murein DD-endopeptidase MepM/ murein hydrolase activator NlpD
LGLAGIWRFNCILAFLYLFVASGFPFLQSSVFEYSNVSSDPFDGTTAPIAYVPNWLETKNTNKSLVFADIDISEFQELPKYNISILDDDSGKNSNALQMRYTYPVVYMGSYRGNYKEYDGSHVGVDIRAPIGTPVLAIANGVVVKTKFDETGDGKYIVIRHENVVFGGESQTLYSSYLHLAEIAVEEGQKISKGAVIGKVGMTGITTTPHLHFQIDTKLSPFHPYWPFTFLEAKKANVDFFEAINIGL